jgi:rSAM/selenodomain-associated transferase 2
LETATNVSIEQPDGRGQQHSIARPTAVPVRISVIIPALNEEPHIERAIDSALAAGAHEVIVADGGSADLTIKLARARGATVVHSNPGRAVQQNAGADLATGEVLLFLHADNRLTASAGWQVSEAVLHDGAIAGAFRQHIDADSFVYRLLERGNAARARLLGAPYGDQAIFINRNSFVAIGGFPETRLMEDILLMRAVRQRTRPVLLPGPVHVDARRWRKYGVVRQTACNLAMALALKLGVSPNRLADIYPQHD